VAPAALAAAAVDVLAVLAAVGVDAATTGADAATTTMAAKS
jgi:hypothetical protein